jgi:CBS-domain-containing membrane protein
MIVSDVMSVTPATAGPQNTLFSAVRKMLESHSDDLMIVDEQGRLLGVLSSRALAKRAELGTNKRERSLLSKWFLGVSSAIEYVHGHSLHVQDVMIQNVPLAYPEMDLAKAERIMKYHKVNSLPVVEAGKLVGILRYTDLLQALEKILSTARPESDVSDSAILKTILRAVNAESWAPKTGINIMVEHGKVSIGGVVFSDDERKALLVVATSTQGVREVHDGLLRSYQVE